MTGTGADDVTKRLDRKNKGLIFKDFVSFRDCISEINNTRIDHAKILDVVMPMNDLMKYSDNHSKTSVSLWQYYRDEPATTYWILNHSNSRLEQQEKPLLMEI